MPYSTGTTLRVREFRGASKGQRAVDHNRRHGGVEPDPPYLRQRHPGGVRFPAHLGRAATAQPASTMRALRFDVGQRTTAANRRKIYNAAVAHRRMGLCGAAFNDAHMGTL